MIKSLLLLFIANLVSCTHLFYLPDSHEHHHPSRKKLAYEDVELKVGEEKLHGWYFPSKKPKALVLFFHGNANNLSSHYLTLSWLPYFNVDYFIFDYQGYGKSSGSPSPEKTVNDGIAAIEWSKIKAKKLGVPLIIFAQSLGGAIALRSIAESKQLDPLKQIIIDSSFLSYQSAANRALKRSWITWPFQWLAYLLVSDEYAPENKFNELKKYPLLVIHGKKDQVVPYDLGRNLYERFEGPKDMWTIENGEHIDSFWTHRNQYRGKMVQLIEKISKEYQTKKPR